MPVDTEFIGARVPKELADLARKVGGGNLSEGVRLALEYLERHQNRRPTQAEIHDAIRTLASAADQGSSKEAADADQP